MGGVGRPTHRVEMGQEDVMEEQVGRPSRRAVSGQEALLESRERPGVFGRPFQRGGRVRENLQEDWEGLGGPQRIEKGQEGRERMGGPPGDPEGAGSCPEEPGRIRTPFQRHRSSRERREGTGSPSGGPGRVGRSSQRAGRSREALMEGREFLLVGQEGLGGPSGWPGGLEALPKGWEESGVLYGSREGS